MNYLKFVLILFLSVNLFNTAGADSDQNTLDEFEQLFEEVMANYNDVKRYKDESRYTSAFEKKLTQLYLKGRQVQTVIARLRIEDIDIPHEVNRLKERYYDLKMGRNAGGKGSIEDRTGKWDPASKIRGYINKLKKMNFSVEKESFDKETEQRETEGFKEFEELFNYYSRHIKNALIAPKKSSWLDTFEDKLSRMVVLGREIQTKISREKLDMNFSKEVVFLAESYRKNTFTSSERSVLRRTKTKSSDKMTENEVVRKKEQLDKDISLSIDKLREYILKLKEKEFVLNPEIAEKNKKSAKSKRAEKNEYAADEAEDDSYETKSKEDLVKLLLEARKKIYKSDRKLGGVSKNTVDAYLDTLSSGQKKHYKMIYEKYKNRGYEKDQAASFALMEVHSQFQFKQGDITKKEIIKILESLDKNKDK